MEVLRIFFQRNTFVFRVTELVERPLEVWLGATGMRFGSGSGGAFGSGSRDDGNDGYEYAGGAARLIERVAIEREVPKTCVVQRVEDRSQMEGEVHTWRVVVGVESMKKVQKKKKDGENGEGEGEEKKKKKKKVVAEEEEEHQPQPRPSSSTTQHPARPILTVHHEADLTPTCACTLRAAASLSPRPGGAFTRPHHFSPRAAEVLSFACDVEDQVFRDLAGDCSLGSLCDAAGIRRRRHPLGALGPPGRMRTTRVCEVCGGDVSSGLFGFEGGVGDRLMPWYEMVARGEGRL